MQQTQQSDPFFETPLKPEVIEAKVEAETSLWKREGDIVAEQEIKEKEVTNFFFNQALFLNFSSFLPGI